MEVVCTGTDIESGKLVKGHYWTDNVDAETHYIQTFDPETFKAIKDRAVHKNSVHLSTESQILHTWIPYHPDHCCGCTDVIHDMQNYNIIFICNECGEKRSLILEDNVALPTSFLSLPIKVKKMSAIKELKAVLLDPDGDVSIRGSDEDREIIARALKEIEKQLEFVVKNEPLGKTRADCLDKMLNPKDSPND